MQTHKLKWDYQSAMYRRVVVFHECFTHWHVFLWCEELISKCIYIGCDPTVNLPRTQQCWVAYYRISNPIELTGATWCEHSNLYVGGLSDEHRVEVTRDRCYE